MLYVDQRYAYMAVFLAVLLVCPSVSTKARASRKLQRRPHATTPTNHRTTRAGDAISNPKRFGFLLCHQRPDQLPR